MPKITAENIHKVCKRKEVELPIVGKCYVTQVTAKMGLKITSLGDLEEEDPQLFNNHFIAYSLVDENGQSVIDDGAIHLISDMFPSALIQSLMAEISAINDFDEGK